MKSVPTPDRPELAELINRSVKAFEALTPEQQQEHRLVQRRSWVIGEMLLSHPNMTREYAERIYDGLEF